MREYKNAFGEVLDLDDPITYDYLPDDWKILDDLMFKEIGFYYCYVDFFHPDWDFKQEERCDKMIKEFCDNRSDNYKDVMWFKEQVFLFQDETENMC